MFHSKNDSDKGFNHILVLFIITIATFSCQNSSEPAKENSLRINSSNQPGVAEVQDSVDQNNGTTKRRTNSALEESRRNAITKAVQQVSPAVVSITVTETIEGRRRIEFLNRFFFAPIDREISSVGSGFVISDDGLIVTNAHVANENAEEIMVSLPGGSQYEAEIVGVDRLADITLLKLNVDRAFPYIEFGNSENVIVGEWAVAIGNPFGLFEAAQPSVTVGVVSATQRDFRPSPREPRVYLDMIQTDAAINQGNSGGPLVNSQGKVIGINTFIFTGGTSAGFVGLGFAIPSNRAKKIIRQLVANGEVEKTYNLGMETTPMTYQLVQRNNLPAVPGLFVTNVNRDGPAFQSGIMPGDIILKIENTWVQSQMHAQALFREFSTGDTMRVVLSRDRERYEAEIPLRDRVSGN